MHRLTITYTGPADAEAFGSHYAEVHIPLVRQLPGLTRFTLTYPRGLGRR